MSTDERAVEINVTYALSPHPQDNRRNLEDIAGACDGVYLSVTEALVSETPMAVRLAVEDAHEQGLIAMLDLRGYGNLFAGGAGCSLLAARHPEYDCLTSAGKPLGRVCPSKSAVRSAFRFMVRDLTERFEPDGLLFNQPSWELSPHLGTLEPGEWLCRCADCQAAFKAAHGFELPSSRTPEVRAFQTGVLAKFLEELCAEVKAAGDHLVTAVCLGPESDIKLQQVVAEIADLDVLGYLPSALSTPDDADALLLRASDFLTLARERGRLAELWVSTLEPEPHQESSPAQWAVQLGALDVDSLGVSAHRDWSSAEPVELDVWGDPDDVWEQLCAAFQAIREGRFDEEQESA